MALRTLPVNLPPKESYFYIQKIFNHDATWSVTALMIPCSVEEGHLVNKFLIHEVQDIITNPYKTKDKSEWI